MKPGDRLSQAFHEVWSRPYGCPKTIYMDPTNQNLSKEFQAYLVENDIQLWLAAAESHWQLGRVEIANRILRGMAQRCWQATSRPAEEVIEICASIRNEHLRRNGFSPSQWFLEVNPRHAGMLDQIEDLENPAIACMQCLLLQRSCTFARLPLEPLEKSALRMHGEGQLRIETVP